MGTARRRHPRPRSQEPTVAATTPHPSEHTLATGRPARTGPALRRDRPAGRTSGQAHQGRIPNTLQRRRVVLRLGVVDEACPGGEFCRHALVLPHEAEHHSHCVARSIVCLLDSVQRQTLIQLERHAADRYDPAEHVC
jgi:hypothetical protein